MAAKKSEAENTTVEAPAATDEAKITIDGTEYAVSDLSDEAKAQINSLRYIEVELQRLQAQAAVLNTAKRAYGASLKALLSADD